MIKLSGTVYLQRLDENGQPLGERWVSEVRDGFISLTTPDPFVVKWACGIPDIAERDDPALPAGEELTSE